MKIFIIYHRLFDLDGTELTIGGIQTYLLNLSQVFISHGHSVALYQLANNSWEREHKGIKVSGIKRVPTKSTLQQSKKLLNAVLQKANKERDILIWGTDSISIKTSSIKTLSIQHGIGFDYIAHNSSKLNFIRKLKLQNIYKILQRYKSIKSFMCAEHKVCVDYNYLNWIRTMLPRNKLRDIHLIPNFTHVNDLKNINHQDTKEIKILFARRFSEERGVLILIDIIDALLKKYNNVAFTIAGDGPYASLLQEKYNHHKNIVITKFKHHESLEVHSNHHIAIIPTYGSEGTSLSLLEAMTSGCVPVASNVGGMTNIVLDNYNGYLNNPTAKEFTETLSLLIENKELRQRISRSAKESADNAFSYSLWEKKWIKVINEAF